MGLYTQIKQQKPDAVQTWADSAASTGLSTADLMSAGTYETTVDT
jgi:hypothetical protein